MIVVLFGPQGIGKSTHARAIADALGCDQIIDNWDGQTRIAQTDALVITNHPAPVILSEEAVELRARNEKSLSLLVRRLQQ
ncbi:MAG: hypothetical protein FWD77_01450 [Betaproteobacteria bacterium]|nr:hypothetical protein [Betaproteobacteria bacterium]